MNFRLLAISAFLLVCPFSISWAQSHADRYFEHEQFYKAARMYNESLTADSTNLHAAFQLAECYRKLFNYEQAERYYEIVYEKDSVFEFPLSLYFYALTQKYNEEFRAAIVNFDKFLAYSKKQKKGIENYRYYEQQAVIERKGCYFALTQLSRRNKNYGFTKLPSPINSEYNDYAPSVYHHDSLVVITTGRISSGQPIDNRFGESFGNIYQFEKKVKGWTKVEKDDGFGIVNTKWADGSGTFNKEKTKYYYTSCDKKNETCQIYITVYKNNKWQEPLLLNENINAPKANAKQPALTASGDTLFFVSDRSGGFGAQDIWMSISAGGEDWGPAVNLGEKVNTPANDLSPFYYYDKPALFFSSNGHEGFGGLDIYRIEGKITNGEVINLGWPFNSSRDDLYFVFGENTGYLSSNRDTVATKFDIYAFTKKTGQSLVNYINEGTRKKREPVVVSQKSYNEQLEYDGLIEGNITGIQTPVSDLSMAYTMGYQNLRSGANRFILSADASDDLTVNGDTNRVYSDSYAEPVSLSELLLPPESTLTAQTPAGVLTTINTLHISDSSGKAILTGELLDAISQAPVAEEIVQLANDDGDIIKITTTDKTGSFKFSNLDAQARYSVVLDKPVSGQNADYYLTDVKVFSYGSDISTIEFEKIYFNNNTFQLRNEAKLVLDDLLSLFQENPEIQVEINAYTDSRGTDSYNVELSRKRGKAAFDYLIAHGIDRTAVVMNAKGKETPIASNDNPAGKQLNRRVEFEVIGPDISYRQSSTTLVVKSGMSLSELAAVTAMSPTELQALNNFESTYIPAYTPVRVKRPVGHIDKALFAGITRDAKEEVLRRD